MMYLKKISDKNKKWPAIILAGFAFIAIIAAVYLLTIKESNNNKKIEEPIIYGDIDFDAPIVSPKKPESMEAQDSTQGTTYLNLMNNGLFCETEEYYYFVIKYDSEKYLIRRSKENDENTKIFKGDIRNLFAVNGWIYGIVNEDTNECMIAMDYDGNNQFVSSRYLNNIRTMQTNGNKIYYTVDQRNVLGMSVATAICQCNMDLTNEEPIKTVSNQLSQVDIIAIQDGQVYFNETFEGASQADIFIPVDVSLEQYPVFNNATITVFNNSVCSMILNKNITMNCLNKHNDIIYISAYDSENNYLIEYNIKTKESSYKNYENKIDEIFEYSKGIVLYSNGKYERIEK